MQSFKAVIAYCSFLLLFNKCSSQSSKIENCKINYRQAKDRLNNFYMTHDTLLIVGALENINNSLICPGLLGQITNEALTPVSIWSSIAAKTQYRFSIFQFLLRGLLS